MTTEPPTLIEKAADALGYWAGACDPLTAANLLAEALREHVEALDALHNWAVDTSYMLSTDECNDWSEELDNLARIEQGYRITGEYGERP